MAYHQNEFEAELVRQGITRAKLAEELNITTGTVSKKINGKSDWTMSEVQTIIRHIGLDSTIRIFFS